MSTQNDNKEPARGGRHLKPAAEKSNETAARRTETTARPRHTEETEAERPVRSRIAEDEQRAPRQSAGAPAPATRSKTARPSDSRDPEDDRPPVKHKKRRKKKKKVGLIILIVVLALLLIIAGVVFFVFRDMYSSIGSGSHASSGASGLTMEEIIASEVAAAAEDEELEEEETAEPTAEPTATPEPLTEDEQVEQELQQDAEEIMYSDDVYNILLIGSDGRTEELERSDAMILLSINFKTKDIWLTSLMRDTQVTIANWGTGHLNWATRFGGVQMLIDTIESEQNFAIKIDNYAMVDFVDFIEVADMLGPITVTVDPTSAKDMNHLIREACQTYDAAYGLEDEDETYPRSFFNNHPEDPTIYDVPAEETTYTITNGAQILGYCRERHVGGDTGRSEKQRDVLQQFWSNVQNMSLKEQYELVKKVMSIVTTDITMGQCASLLLKAPELVTYEIHTQQCPVAGAFWKGLDDNSLSIYNADFRVNRNFLRATIYAEPMTAADLTSDWTGEKILVMEPTA